MKKTRARAGHRLLVWFVLFVFSSLVAGCGRFPMVIDDPCAPPCWQGITPGVTTRAEALDKLRELPLIDPNDPQAIRTRFTSIGEYKTEDYGRYEQVDFTFAKAGSGLLILEDGVVIVTHLRAPNLILDDIIKSLGEPEFVWTGGIGEAPRLAAYAFAYPGKGLLLDGDARRSRRDMNEGVVTLTPGLPIGGIEYFSPMSLKQYALDRRGMNDQDASAWAEDFMSWPGLGMRVRDSTGH